MMQHTVRVQLQPANSRKIVSKLRKDGFRAYLVNPNTGEYEPIDDDPIAIKASSASAGSKGYFVDCFYNSETGFPPQKILQAIAAHKGVIYFSANRGDIINVLSSPSAP